ncbi:MAG: hypothetical protein J6S56_01170 [Bacteroidales bacterium]|nr:hypothetical protein [Bacteroidales bacterium]
MKGRKTVLYIIFLIVLMLPLLQALTRLVPERELTGVYISHERPSLTVQSWFDGSFQAAFEPYTNEHLGFHNSMVRLHNLFCLKAFHQINAQNVVLGKENYLYEQDFIDAYYGTDFIGRDSILSLVKKTKELQDLLAAKGKTLVVFLAPSKADFFPEYIPDSLKKKETNNTNYKVFSQLLKQNNINVIDYNAYYLSQKKSSPYPLYPQYGIHWSDYGMVHATDSLLRYLSQKCGYNLSKLVIDENTISQKAQKTDYDLGDLLNLAGKQLRGYPLCYPKWHWEEDTTAPKPHLTVIADSYYWAIFNMGIQQFCFNGSFWYYNHTVYPESYTTETITDDLNMKDEIEKTDIFLIMSTTPSLKKFSWRALDSLLR